MFGEIIKKNQIERIIRGKNINLLIGEQEIKKDDYDSILKYFYTYFKGESNERPKRLNIFTLKSDNVLEECMDDFKKNHVDIYFNDGSRGLYKRYVENHNRNFKASYKGLYESIQYEIPTINLFKMKVSNRWIKQEKKILKVQEENINLKSDEALKEVVFAELYYQNLRNMSYELEKKQAILIVYNYKEINEDIDNTITRALNNPEIMVLVMSEDEKQEKTLKEHFKEDKKIRFYKK